MDHSTQMFYLPLKLPLAFKKLREHHKFTPAFKKIKEKTTRSRKLLRAPLNEEENNPLAFVVYQVY